MGKLIILGIMIFCSIATSAEKQYFTVHMKVEVRREEQENLTDEFVIYVDSTAYVTKGEMDERRIKLWFLMSLRKKRTFGYKRSLGGPVVRFYASSKEQREGRVGIKKMARFGVLPIKLSNSFKHKIIKMTDKEVMEEFLK